MYEGFMKRTLDIVLSLLALAILLILFIPVAIAIKFEDGGPQLSTWIEDMEEKWKSSPCINLGQ